MLKRAAVFSALVALLATSVLASFAGTDVFLPSVGRGPGNAGSFWYTTAWVYNPNPDPVQVQVYLLERGSSNASPLVFTDTVQAGDTRRYADAVFTLFGVEKNGALRFVSTARVIVNGRIYSQPSGGQEKDTVGQFFAAIPASFAIGPTQKTELLGVYQTAPFTDSQYRYNFGFVETTGHAATVRVTALDETGLEQNHKDYPLGAFGALQYQAKNEFPALSTPNARFQVEVIGGSGHVVAFGSGLANTSNDPSTFEMSFRDDLLAENVTSGITGVTAGAGLSGGGTSGNVTVSVASGGVTSGMLAAGAVGNQQLASNAVDATKLADSSVTSSKLTDSAVASTKLADNAVSTTKLADTSVSTAKLADNAVSNTKLADNAVSNAKLANSAVTSAKVAAGQVVKSLNGLADAVTLAAGSNVTITPSGQTLTIAATGGGGSGSITGVTPGTGLTGGGISGNVTLSIANGGVGALQIADTAVAKAKLAATGGASGQVLATNGSALLWQNDALTLPFAGTGSGAGTAFSVTSSDGRALSGTTQNGSGVYGESTTATGHAGYFSGRVHVTQDLAVEANVSAASATVSPAVSGASTASADGVSGTSTAGNGVKGQAAGAAVAGVSGVNTGAGAGVLGSAGKLGVSGLATAASQGTGVLGQANGLLSSGVHGVSDVSNGVLGESRDGFGVNGSTTNGDGVFGTNQGSDTVGYAGYFDGRVVVSGNLSKAGGSFLIDHPLDPENKVLYHSFVESPDMKNIYDGVVTTDEQGLAVVVLPDWFGALNRDFRYQLTCIGRFAQAIVEREIEGNRFTIRTNLADVKVSWQVTGIRKDAWANANRIPVEEAKPAAERGTYLHPAAFGLGEDKSVERVRHPEARNTAFTR